MKNTVVYIETANKKYPLSFNLNVMEEIQEHYGSLDAWGQVTQGDGEPKVKDLKCGVMAMLNEGIDMTPYFKSLTFGSPSPCVTLPHASSEP